MQVNGIRPRLAGQQDDQPRSRSCAAGGQRSRILGDEPELHDAQRWGIDWSNQG